MHKYWLVEFKTLYVGPGYVNSDPKQPTSIKPYLSTERFGLVTYKDEFAGPIGYPINSILREHHIRDGVIHHLEEETSLARKERGLLDLYEFIVLVHSLVPLTEEEYTTLAELGDQPGFYCTKITL